jgi:hypothetical protein
VYAFMGDTLGGLPTDPACYTGGKVDYSKVRQRDWFVRGLERLEAGWRSGHRIALMCAEIEPNRCHRTKLLGEALAARNVPIEHIDEEGQLITQQAAMLRLTGGQGTLFELGYTSRRIYKPEGDGGA